MVIFLCPHGHEHTEQWRADCCATCRREGRAVIPRQMAMAVAALTAELENAPWIRETGRGPSRKAAR
jgi:hypothetical protein